MNRHSQTYAVVVAIVVVDIRIVVVVVVREEVVAGIAAVVGFDAGKLHMCLISDLICRKCIKIKSV